MANCTELEPTLTAYLYNEVNEEERAACEAHLTACETCRASVEKHRQLGALLSQRSTPEMTSDLLVQCRLRLDEALDRDQLGWRGLFGGVLNPAPRALTSRFAVALTLMIFGFGLGWMFRPFGTGQQTRHALPGGPVELGAADLGNMQINDITQVRPDPNTGAVHITLSAERRLKLEGSIDDPHIQRLLLSAVKGYQNPGIRRDTLEALKARSENPSVRQAMLYEVEHDPNAGVRLEALQSTQKMDWGPDLEQTLVSAVENEENAGVRFAAVDMLSNHALNESDTTLLPTLRKLSTADPDNYVRLKCALAVHALTAEGGEQ